MVLLLGYQITQMLHSFLGIPIEHAPILLSWECAFWSSPAIR